MQQISRNGLGFSDPVSGGVNASDSKVVVEDARGWLEICKVATVRCSMKQSLNVMSPEGEAYAPSDK